MILVIVEALRLHNNRNCPLRPTTERLPSSGRTLRSLADLGRAASLARLSVLETPELKPRELPSPKLTWKLIEGPIHRGC